MHQLNFRSGATAVAVATALTAIGGGIASASAFDDQGAGLGQSDNSADSGYQQPGDDSGSSGDSGYAGNPYGGGSTPGSANPANGVVNGLASPQNAGSSVTPNGLSPGETLPGGSLGGL
jgi:hypothetical protein